MSYLFICLFIFKLLLCEESPLKNCAALVRVVIDCMGVPGMLYCSQKCSLRMTNPADAMMWLIPCHSDTDKQPINLSADQSLLFSLLSLWTQPPSLETSCMLCVFVCVHGFVFSNFFFFLHGFVVEGF